MKLGFSAFKSPVIALLRGLEGLELVVGFWLFVESPLRVKVDDDVEFCASLGGRILDPYPTSGGSIIGEVFPGEDTGLRWFRGNGSG